MALEIVTSWEALMNRAAAVGRARIAGDTEALTLAEKDLADYERLVRESDSMIIPQEGKP